MVGSSGLGNTSKQNRVETGKFVVRVKPNRVDPQTLFAHSLFFNT